MTDLTIGTRVRVTSGEFAGNDGVITDVFTYSAGTNTDYDVVLDNIKSDDVDGSYMIEDYELEAI